MCEGMDLSVLEIDKDNSGKKKEIDKGPSTSQPYPIYGRMWVI
jgi:hypothetical protein